MPADTTTDSLPAAFWEDIESLTPWNRNPRDNEAAISKVAASIQRFGFGAPVLVRTADRILIAGHTRVLAAKKLGLDKIPVRFLDLDPDQAAALALADNKLGEIATWDDEMLSAVLKDLDGLDIELDGLGWDDDELDALLNTEAPTSSTEGDGEAPAVGKEVFSNPGEVYELGPHRLVCGNSTDVESWNLLLPGNEEVRMVWSDPPYGVAYVGKTEDALTIQNDDLDEAGLEVLLHDSLGHALHACVPGAAWYIASPAGPLFHVFGTVLKKFETWRHTLVWLKSTFVMGRCDYHYKHEAIFYGWKPGGPHYWCGSRNLDSILLAPKPSRNKDHPTMKPLELITQCIENSSEPGWIVADPFGGSGSTLLACALTGRRGRLIELDPNYCDVIRRRWTVHARANGVDPGPGYLDLPEGSGEE